MAKRKNVPQVVAQPQITSNNVLEETNCLCFDQLIDHVAENGSHGVEPFICVADIGQTRFIEEDLLDDKDCDCFGKFGSGLHDAKAKRNNLGRKQEVDDGIVVILL